MQNAEIALMFDELADLLEVDGANPFRVRAYRNAARTIESLTESVASIAADEHRNLQELPGIGKDLALKIQTICATGRLKQLDGLREKIPTVVVQMLRLPSMGPKKAAALAVELNLKTLDDLKLAAEQNRIAPLKGFGKKSQEAILEAVSRDVDAERRFNRHDARQEVEVIVADLLASRTVTRAEIAGSYRRRRDTVGDLDLLATAADSKAAMDRLAEHSMVTGVIARGETKQRVRLVSGLELDLRVVPDQSFGAALQYFTGSKEHNIVIRRRAQERGLKLNEYGVFRGDELIAGGSEEDVYATVELPWFPPEIRENRGEIEAAEQGDLPELVTLSDIRGDLHMHTDATDGKATIREMVEAARERGLDYIAITDHSKRVMMAGGLDAERLREHWRNIEQIDADYSDFAVLKGIECDILEDATLDLPDDVLSEADWVIAVLHYSLRQPQEQIMERLITAIRCPWVDVIGHPTGRLLGSHRSHTHPRDGAEIDMDALLDAAARHGVMMEINAHWNRLDLSDIHAAAARERGIPIVISTDAHSTSGLNVMEYGIWQARRASLTKEQVANTRPWEELRTMLHRGQKLKMT